MGDSFRQPHRIELLVHHCGLKGEQQTCLREDCAVTFEPMLNQQLLASVQFYPQNICTHLSTEAQLGSRMFWAVETASLYHRAGNELGSGKQIALATLYRQAYSG